MSQNSNLSYEEQICQAIEVLLNKGLSGAQFDKTIQGIVIDVVDVNKGEYKVQYQDSTFTARAACPGIEYQRGTEVYVLIPLDNYKNEKIILWSGQGLSRFGALPITSMTIYANDEYEVTTREGKEKYRALYDEQEEEETTEEEDNSDGS